MKKAQKKKKIVKKVSKKRSAKKVSSKKPLATKARAVKPAGIVTHYFAAIKVAIIKCKQPVPAGITIGFRGATTDFDQVIASMQYDHKPISRSKKGQEIGVKVHRRVREGDSVLFV